MHPISKMEATGVPPHIVLANQLTGVHTELAAIKETLLVRLAELPEELKKTLLENFRIDGVVPLTHSEMQLVIRSAIEESSGKLLAAVSEMMQASSLAGRHENMLAFEEYEQFPQNIAGDGAVGEIVYASFQWDGRIDHAVPKGFEFPR